MTDRVHGGLAELYDMDGEISTLEDLVRERLGPTVDNYDVDAIVQEYREAVNARLGETGMSLDANSDVVADGFIEDNPRNFSMTRCSTPSSRRSSSGTGTEIPALRSSMITLVISGRG
ncbi:hypothetical protein [Lentzea pudingi]|nr:hypothetical protein [Lentzea pudingi]